MPDGAGLRPAAGDALLTLPNAITFARLCAVPVAVWLVLEHRLIAAFALFVAAGISDAVDGWLARRQGSTRIGAILDPLADKALLVSMYVTLAAVGELPDWLAILVVFRDVVIVGGVVLLAVLGQPVVIRPLRISKLNTALQILLVAATLMVAGFGLVPPVGLGSGYDALLWPRLWAQFLGGAGPDFVRAAAMAAMVWLVGATTLASGAAYVWRTVRT
ncbi:MAG: CDP-alcohol phosphatidyltransferase family protein [Rhodospirillales bacterium]|nr:CDP-alcohol phosphatidyltransferase family protein [Rhodospirillales bacterium]